MGSHVLHIDSGGDWRGGQRQLFLLALEQRKRGTEPLVVSQPRSRLVVRLRSSGVASSGVRMHGKWDLNAVRRIRRLIRMWRPQIVHAHDVRAHALARKALMGISDASLVVSCRTIPRKAITSPWRVIQDTRFLVPNNDVRDILIAAGVQHERIDMVPPGVPVHADVRPRDWRKEGRWPADVTVCGVIGVSGRSSGTMAELRAILSRMPSDIRRSIRVVILGGAGSGETHIAGASAFNAGFVDDIAAAIAGFDVLVNLSGEESMSSAVIDAMAMGVPPVAWSSGGAGEYIEHGKSGFVVPYGDAVAFASALSSLVKDEELRDTLAAFGPGRASRFTAARMAEATEIAYEKARGNPRQENSGSVSA